MSKYIYDPPYNNWYGIKNVPDSEESSDSSNKHLLTMCGSMETIPASVSDDVTIGDVYYIEDEGKFYLWANGWYALTDTIAEQSSLN